MGHYCAGTDCQTWIADEIEFCTSCRGAFERSVDANLREIEKKLAAHRLFAAWLKDHPEYEEDK